MESGIGHSCHDSEEALLLWEDGSRPRTRPGAFPILGSFLRLLWLYLRFGANPGEDKGDSVSEYMNEEPVMAVLWSGTKHSYFPHRTLQKWVGLYAQDINDSAHEGRSRIESTATVAFRLQASNGESTSVERSGSAPALVYDNLYHLANVLQVFLPSISDFENTTKAYNIKEQVLWKVNQNALLCMGKSHRYMIPSNRFLQVKVSGRMACLTGCPSDQWITLTIEDNDNFVPSVDAIHPVNLQGYFKVRLMNSISNSATERRVIVQRSFTYLEELLDHLNELMVSLKC